MEESQRFQEKKDITHKFPGGFSSPEWPVDHQIGTSTTHFDVPYSCFLTPPSSSEKVVISSSRLDSFEDLTKPNFELDDGDWELFPKRSPLFPADRIIGRQCGKLHLDIISSLLALGCNSSCEKICSYMKPQDLYRFAHVSSIWRNFVQQHPQRSRWRGYVRKCKETFIEREKENHGTPRYQNLTSNDNLPRLTFSQVNLNSHQRQSQDQPNKVPATPVSQLCRSHSITPQIKNGLRPCPKCTSPSTVSKSHKGHFQCRNQKCGVKFCPTCLRYTEQHVKSKICYGLSTAQKSDKDIIGRKKSRDRLRRF